MSDDGLKKRAMQQIINMVKEKAGISESQAQQAVNTVANFLKDKLPAGVGTQVDSFLKDGSPTTGNTANDLKGKIGGMFGK